MQTSSSPRCRTLDARGVPSLNPIVEGSRASTLDRIADAGTTLAIWRRRPPRGLANWLDSLPADRLPSGRFTAEPHEVPAAVAALCDLAKLDHAPQRGILIADIAELAIRFARVAGATRIDVRLEAIDHDACWRFHRDYVGLRLNATYRGPGTQWPPLEQAAQAMRRQRRYRGALNELPRFAAGLFKGATRAGERAVLHRSPPVAAGGITRLFLCIDEERDND